MSFIHTRTNNALRAARSYLMRSPGFVSLAHGVTYVANPHNLQVRPTGRVLLPTQKNQR